MKYIDYDLTDFQAIWNTLKWVQEEGVGICLKWVLRQDVSSSFWLLIGPCVPILIPYADWFKTSITRWTCDTWVPHWVMKQGTSYIPIESCMMHGYQIGCSCVHGGRTIWDLHRRNFLSFTPAWEKLMSHHSIPIKWFANVISVEELPSNKDDYCCIIFGHCCPHAFFVSLLTSSSLFSINFQ